MKPKIFLGILLRGSKKVDLYESGDRCVFHEYVVGLFVYRFQIHSVLRTL